MLPYEKVEGLNVRHGYKLLLSAYHEYTHRDTTMRLACVLRHAEYFYYDMFMDWRGRFYSVGDYINYQGHKLGLALLEFAQPKRLGVEGFDYIKIYGANLYGVKGTIKARLDWVEHNHHNILGMNREFMRGASECEIFVAFAIEYGRIVNTENPSEYQSRLPILVDCTCNGLQHLAAMVGDCDLGRDVNLVNDLVLHDVYNRVAVKCATTLEKKCGVRVDRAMIKKVVMTIPYNASKHTIASYLAEHFEYSVHDGLYH